MPLLVVPSDERLNAMSNFTCLCVGDSQKFYMYLKTLLGPLLFRLIFSDRSWRRIRETSVEFEAFSFVLSFRHPVTAYSTKQSQECLMSCLLGVHYG